MWFNPFNIPIPSMPHRTACSVCHKLVLRPRNGVCNTCITDVARTIVERDWEEDVTKKCNNPELDFLVREYERRKNCLD